MSLQAISRHLRVLENVGLITRGRDAQYRPCRFETATLEEALTWIEQRRNEQSPTSATAEPISSNSH
jgi:DNA-binding transcriptional ArsR family regulator